MTFTEMIVKTHPNDDIGDIIIDGKCYPLLTYNRDLPDEEIPPYWIDEKNFIYAGSCPFAVLRKATFVNIPHVNDRIAFTAEEIYPVPAGKEYTGTIYMGCAPETITPKAL